MTRTTRFINLYQVGAGLSDTLTGILLLAAPAYTLRLMLVRALPQPIEYAKFIGIFVLSVGLTYLLVVWRWPLARSLPDAVGVSSAAAWKIQWALTAMIRALVAVFLFSEIAAGRMEAAWLTVAVSDAALAGIQIVGLSRGWLDHAS